MDFFRSAPPTEVLRIESEPPGADARTAEGQSCRPPCALTVASAGVVAVSFALQGYNAQTINVRAEAPPTASYAEGAPPTRMQPNPVYAELTPLAPPQKKRSPPRKKVAKKSAPVDEPIATGSPPPADRPPPAAPPRSQPAQQAPASSSFPSNYPWPPPPPPQ
jgi:hypothetical protein